MGRSLSRSQPRAEKERGPGLSRDPFHREAVARQVLGQKLQRHVAAELEVFGRRCVKIDRLFRCPKSSNSCPRLLSPVVDPVRCLVGGRFRAEVNVNGAVGILLDVLLMRPVLTAKPGKLRSF
jgi:hypothetical protein